VIFALEIVEESPFADIRGFGDVLQRDIRKTALSKKLKCTTEQAQTRLGGATLAASHALQVREVLRSQSFDESGGMRSTGVIHDRPRPIYDYQSYLLCRGDDLSRLNCRFILGGGCLSYQCVE